MFNLYFIGINDILLQNTNVFAGSITVVRKFETTKNNICFNDIFPNKKVDYNNIADLKKIDRFFIRTIKLILKKDPNAYFIRYNEHNLKGYNCEKYHVLSANSYKLLNYVNNKFKIRENLRNNTNVLDYKYKHGFQVFNFLKKRLKNSNNSFVVQEKFGFAGCNTFIINSSNLKQQCKKLKKFKTYAISNFISNNQPVNIHIFITDNKIEYFAPSMQIIDKTKGQLNYDGADFNLSSNLITMIKKNSVPICEYLQKIGYRGVLGIDYIFADNTLYFMEINARFQSSTFKLDDILKSKNADTILDKQITYLTKKYSLK